MNPQSGERFPASITSDCLARLEGGEKPNFNEKIIREVSGVMFTGKSFPHPALMFLTVGYSCSRDGTLRTPSNHLPDTPFRQRRPCRRSS